MSSAWAEIWGNLWKSRALVASLVSCAGGTHRAEQPGVLLVSRGVQAHGDHQPGHSCPLCAHISAPQHQLPILPLVFSWFWGPFFPGNCAPFYSSALERWELCRAVRHGERWDAVAEELVLPCSQSSCVSPCCAPSAMVIHLESLVALSPTAKSAADCLHPLTFQGPTSTAVGLGASATSRFCPWGLTGLCFACSECHLQELLLPCGAAVAAVAERFAPRTAFLGGGCPCSPGQ